MTGIMTGRDADGRFSAGNQAGRRFEEGHRLSVGNQGGRPSSEIRRILREAGEEAIPRIREIAANPKHRDYFKANTWLAERGLKDELQGIPQPKPDWLDLPAPNTSVNQ